MKKKYVIIFLLVFIFIIGIILGICIMNKKGKEENINISTENEIQHENIVFTENDTLVVSIEKNEQMEENTVQEEPKKDAATLTQEIYNINGPIGILRIPKTNVNTQIYSNVTVDKMEEMPCFLYTTGGLNEVGTTLFVGHNRKNGTLFSDNNNLEVGDKFYFKDLNENEKEYTIYSKFVTTDADISFLNENVDKPTIALSCCTDANDDNRIIILGNAE